MPDNDDYNELRAYDRYSIDFEVEVTGLSQNGDPFCDQGQLQNISGGGVSLLTNHAGHYKCGQSLRLKIWLPGTDELEAFMRCDATVERMNLTEASAVEGDAVLIGVSLDKQMTFESHHCSTASVEKKAEN